MKKGSGSVAPPSPLLALILGPPKWPFLTPLAGGQKSPFWGPCGAEPGGGGGAPPTTLILLRNQRARLRVSRARRRPGRRGRLRQLSPASPARPAKNAKFLLFSVVVESCALERGERGGGASIACGDVSHGRPSRPCPMAEVLTDSIGGHPRPDLARSNVLCEALPDLTGRSSRRAAFGSRKRPPPSRNLTVLRGLPSLL